MIILGQVGRAIIVRATLILQPALIRHFPSTFIPQFRVDLLNDIRALAHFIALTLRLPAITDSIDDNDVVGLIMVIIYNHWSTPLSVHLHLDFTIGEGVSLASLLYGFMFFFYGGVDLSFKVSAYEEGEDGSDGHDGCGA